MKFYVDTSVWGGYGDEEFSAWTIPFFNQVLQGKFKIVLSDVTLAELQKHPFDSRTTSKASTRFPGINNDYRRTTFTGRPLYQRRSLKPKVPYGCPAYCNCNYPEG